MFLRLFAVYTWTDLYHKEHRGEYEVALFRASQAEFAEQVRSSLQRKGVYDYTDFKPVSPDTGKPIFQTSEALTKALKANELVFLIQPLISTR